MSETNAFIQCPLCGAICDLTGADANVLHQFPHLYQRRFSMTRKEVAVLAFNQLIEEYKLHYTRVNGHAPFITRKSPLVIRIGEVKPMPTVNNIQLAEAINVMKSHPDYKTSVISPTKKPTSFNVLSTLAKGFATQTVDNVKEMVPKSVTGTNRARQYVIEGIIKELKDILDKTS